MYVYIQSISIPKFARLYTYKHTTVQNAPKMRAGCHSNYEEPNFDDH